MPRPSEETPSKPQQEFRIRGVSVNKSQRRLLFHLSGAQQGCDKIAFDLNESPDLKQLLMGFFSSGQVFSFTIGDTTEQDMQQAICKIDSVQTAID